MLGGPRMANPGAEMAAGPKKSGFFFPTLFSGVIIMGGARILGGPETRISGFWHPGGILTPGWRIWPWPGILAPDTVLGFGHIWGSCGWVWPYGDSLYGSSCGWFGHMGVPVAGFGHMGVPVAGSGYMGILYRGLSCSLSGPWRMFVFLSNV